MRPRVVVSLVFVTIATVAACAPQWGVGEVQDRAEAVCSVGNDEIATMGPMPVLGDREAPAYTFLLAAVQARVARRLSDLDVPGEDDRVLQLAARLEYLVDKSREFATQIQASETASDGEMREAAVDAQNVALDLGLTECALFGLP